MCDFFYRTLVFLMLLSLVFGSSSSQQYKKLEDMCGFCIGMVSHGFLLTLLLVIRAMTVS